MTRAEFEKLLEKSGISRDAVIIVDSIRDGWCVRKNHQRWEVCFRERGRESSCTGFPSESDALQYLTDKLMKLNQLHL